LQNVDMEVLNMENDIKIKVSGDLKWLKNYCC
jgi:hypothetical protein